MMAYAPCACAVDHIIIECHIPHEEVCIPVHILAPFLEIIPVDAVPAGVYPISIKFDIPHHKDRIVMHIVSITFHAVMGNTMVSWFYDVLVEGYIAHVKGWIVIQKAAPEREKIKGHGMGN